MLRLEGIRSGYGIMDVLHGIDLAIAQRETVAILGPNGAGKTVLLKTMSGALRCRTGRIVLDGEDVTALDAAARTKRGLAILPQSRAVFPALSVDENLLMGVYLESDRARQRQAIAHAYERYPSLLPLKRTVAGNLSGGQQKLVGLARAMMSAPRILLLDEPSIGLDPKTLAMLAHEIEALRTSGVTIVLVEQNVRFALRIAERACFLDSGRIAADGPAERYRAERDLIGMYFGKGVTSHVAAR